MAQRIGGDNVGLRFDLVDHGDGNLDLVATGNGLVLESDAPFGADPLPPPDGSNFVARGGGLRLQYVQVLTGDLLGEFRAEGGGLVWQLFDIGGTKTIIADGGGYRAEIQTV